MSVDWLKERKWTDPAIKGVNPVGRKEGVDGAIAPMK